MKTSELIKLVKQADKIQVWINGCGGVAMYISKAALLKELVFNLKCHGDNDVDTRELNNGVLYL